MPRLTHSYQRGLHTSLQPSEEVAGEEEEEEEEEERTKLVSSRGITATQYCRQL